jgi:hypothetical protein
MLVVVSRSVQAVGRFEKTRVLSPGFFSFLSFVGFVQRSPGHLIQASYKQPSHNLESNNGQPMDRGTYHRARGLFGFGYRAVNQRSGRPNGALGDSPGPSEAPPWDWCARNNPSPERAEPAARNPMCYVSPFQGVGELGRRRAQVAGVPRVALRSTLGYLIMPRWGERSRGSHRGSSPSDRGHFQRDDHTRQTEEQ